MSVPIIFVWIGKKLPSYLHSSLKLTKNYNPNMEIILLTNCIHCVSNSVYTYKYIDISSIIKYDTDAKKLVNERTNFWAYTSLRFIALYKYLRDSNTPRCFHAEIDNIVFSLDGLSDKLDNISSGIFAPRDSLYRGIASLAYINNMDALNLIINAFRSPYVKNDMEALGYCQHTYPNLFPSLPTESYSEKPPWPVLSPISCGGIFDAASIGQYLLGVDPKNVPYQVCRNGFINENTLIDFSKTELRLNQDHLWFIHNSDLEPRRIYNIHLHSKNFKPFLDHKLLVHILNDLNRGKYSYVTHKHRWFLHYPYKAYRLLKPFPLRLKCALKKIKSRFIHFLSNDTKSTYRCTSYPFISGDTFATLAGVIYTKDTNKIFAARTDSRNIIFVDSEVCNNFKNFDYLSDFDKVIVHNGDLPVSSDAIEYLVSRNTSIFAVNIEDNLDRSIYAIPIGLENAWMNRNGSLRYYNSFNPSFSNIKKSNSILASFNCSTNPQVRGHYKDICEKYGIINQNYDINSYRRILQQSMFVLSPPGNGIDCHRTWEAFYHRTVPVVEKQFYLFTNHRLPILVVDKIEDFFSLSPSNMNDIYTSIMRSSYPAIYFDYWSQFVYSH